MKSWCGLRLLSPHIRRAVTISKLFDLKAVEVSTFASTIEAFAAGVVLVDENLAIVHANAAAMTMLAANDPIVSRRGRLGLRHQAANGALEAALFQAVQDETRLGQRGIAIPARRQNGEPCVLHVLPLRRGEIRPGLVQRAAAALFIAPTASPPRLPTDALLLLYDLTPAEARIFELICEGRTQAEIAALLGIAAHREDPSAARIRQDRMQTPGRSREARGLAHVAVVVTVSPVGDTPASGARPAAHRACDNQYAGRIRSGPVLSRTVRRFSADFSSSAKAPYRRRARRHSSG